jgi:two-component system NarL family response regulator
MLTHHQIRILTLLAQGNTYKEIGRVLGYSERAIKYHTGEAIRQLQLKDRAEAIAYARAHMQRGSWPQVGDP